MSKDKRLFSYLVTLDNCVNRVYNGYTIHPSVELAYDPLEMSDWTWFWSVAWPRFWNSDVGKGLAIGLFVLSIVATVCMATFTCLKAMAWAYFAVEMGSAAVGFFAGAAVAGFQSMSNGGNFWAEFANYINDNWSQTLAITSVMIMATYAAQAVAGNICFIAGTLVLTAAGYRAIEDIQIGDMVLAYDEETGETAYKPVVRLFRNESKDWTGVTVNGLEIVSTPGHKYFLPETKKWVSAEDLKVGTKVLLSDGSYGIIEAVRAIHYDVPQTTYNFEVADFHTYYVGNGVLVHNQNCGKPEVANRGHTGRTEPNNLYEKLAMEQVKADPLNGAQRLPLKLGDSRWSSSEGWYKMQSVVNSYTSQTTIHFVYNPSLNLVDDFKFVFFKWR